MSFDDEPVFADVVGGNAAVCGSSTDEEFTPSFACREIDPKTIFFEKIALNMMSTLNKSYAYERAFNQLLNYSSYIFSSSPDWANEILKKNIEFKKEKTKKLNISGDYDYPVSPTDYLEQTDIDYAIAKILEANPELSRDFKIERNTEMLSDLLDLNEVEKTILQLALYHTQGVPYPWDDILHTISSAVEFDNAASVYETVFLFHEKDVQTAMQGFLFNSGLLVLHRRSKNMYVIAPEMSEALTDRSLSQKSLSESLFPSCIETELNLDSYPHLDDEIALAEAIINKSVATHSKGINVLLWGSPGTGKTELGLVLAKKNGWDLKVIGDSSKQEMSEKSRAQRITSLKIAMKLYSNTPNVVLLFDEMEDLFKMDNNAQFSKAFINRIIETTPVPIIWTTNDLYGLGGATLRRMTYNIGFEVPPSSTRKLIWKGYVDKHNVGLDDEVIDDLARTYDVVPALIANAVKIAKMADLDKKKDVVEVVKSLDRLVHFGAKRPFTPVVMKDTPYNPRWVNTKQDLARLTGQLLAAKPNFSLLLFGASGTGKSEYARYVAKQMGKRVSYKRYSDLSSMWLGESEKLIRAAFEEAKNEEMFLIIDEGDSMLRNREGAQRSWEITTVNEMLAAMENHTQPFALTTNLMKDLDPAAMRRFTFKMEFLFLREDQANEIFQAYFDQEAPVSLSRLDVLAPGDFAAVKKRADIIHETDPEAIVEMLAEECRVKPQFQKTSMGFGR